MKRPWMIDRRTLLRGAGAAVALPMLEQMIPSFAFAQSAQGPRRTLLFFVPCGMVMSDWTPAQTGANYTIASTSILAPLAPVKSDVLVLTGLQNNVVYDPNGAHATGTGGSMTCSKLQKTITQAQLNNGTSIDQVVANFYRGKTRYASLEVGTSAGSNSGDCDCGYSCAYTRNISWPGGSGPNAKEINPQQLFERLFGTNAPVAQPAGTTDKRSVYRKSVLDLTKEDTLALQRKLGTSDRKKLDEFLAGLRDLETRVSAIPPAVTATCSAPAAPGNPSDLPARAKAMIDLMVLAFSCDLTRSISFMLQNGGSESVAPFGFLGLSNSHHTYSHYQSDSDINALRKINTWEIQQFVYLVQRLKQTQDTGGATLLDNSLVYLASEISDGNEHNVDNLPVLMAGRGGGTVTPGRHLKFQNAPVANAFLTMAQSVDPTATKFANSTGALALK